MEKELEHIIIQKAFEELTSTEKEQLKEWCSTEEEFNQLKMLYSEIELINSENSLKTKASTKRNLDELFEVRADLHVQAMLDNERKGFFTVGSYTRLSAALRGGVGGNGIGAGGHEVSGRERGIGFQQITGNAAHRSNGVCGLQGPPRRTRTRRIRGGRRAPAPPAGTAPRPWRRRRPAARSAPGAP